MANNLKKFATYADYSEAELNYPAVSWILSGNTVEFDAEEPTPPTPPSLSGLVVYYDISDTSNEVTLFNGGGSSSSDSGGGSSESGGGGALPDGMIVDGNAEAVINTWRFSTTGQHIVQYTFDNHIIPQMFLNNDDGNIATITKIEIGDDITTISDDYADEGVFAHIDFLLEVTIGSGITYIGAKAFERCEDLESITINATTPPTLGGDSQDSFDHTGECPIYVPSESVSDYQQSWWKYGDRLEAIQ